MPRYAIIKEMPRIHTSGPHAFAFANLITAIDDQYERERIERDTDRADMERVASRPWRRIKTVDE